MLGDEGALNLYHDAHGLLVRVSTAEGRTVELSHDEWGQIVEVVLIDLSRENAQTLATYDYDAEGNLVRFTDALGNSAHYEYSTGTRQMLRKTDRRGYSFSYAYDSEGRCVHVRGDDGLYDCAMEYRPDLCSTTLTYGDEGVWHYLYDEDQTVHTIVDPYGGRYLWERDELGRVVAKIDSGGHAKRHLFDEMTGAPPARRTSSAIGSSRASGPTAIRSSRASRRTPRLAGSTATASTRSPWSPRARTIRCWSLFHPYGRLSFGRRASRTQGTSRPRTSSVARTTASTRRAGCGAPRATRWAARSPRSTLKDGRVASAMMPRGTASRCRTATAPSGAPTTPPGRVPVATGEADRQRGAARLQRSPAPERARARHGPGARRRQAGG